jgi:hypothetical protein
MGRHCAPSSDEVVQPALAEAVPAPVQPTALAQIPVSPAPAGEPFEPPAFNPYAATYYGGPAHHVAFAPAPMRPARGSMKIRSLLIALGVLVVFAGGGAYGADAYAKKQVCGQVKALTAGAGKSEGSSPDQSSDDIHTEADAMRSKARLLVFDRDLKSAVDGLADDADRSADLRDQLRSSTGSATVVAQALTLVGSIDTHVRSAQKACQLPVTGILGPAQ